MENSIKIIQYKWAGNWGPFKIKISCGECSLSESIIKDVIDKEFSNYNISFEVLPWLNNWYKVLFKGGYHAPIILVNNKIISQGVFLDRGLLSFYLRKEIASQRKIQSTETILFGKDNCHFCRQSKELLKLKNQNYVFYDVVENSLAAAEMLALVKPLIPANQPVTLPQIFLNSQYIGGFDELEKHYKK